MLYKVVLTFETVDGILRNTIKIKIEVKARLRSTFLCAVYYVVGGGGCFKISITEINN